MSTALTLSTPHLDFSGNDLVFREKMNQIRNVISAFLAEVKELEMLHSILFAGDRVTKINNLLDEAASRVNTGTAHTVCHITLTSITFVAT